MHVALDCMFIHVYIYIHMHTHIYTYIHTYVFAHVQAGRGLLPKDANLPSEGFLCVQWARAQLWGVCVCAEVVSACRRQEVVQCVKLIPSSRNRWYTHKIAVGPQFPNM